jgi:hypothetical protein
LQQLLNFFFFCNYYIACCAVMLSLQVFSLSDSYDFIVIAEIFFCTNAIYLLHSVLGINKIPDKFSNSRIIFLKKHLNIIRILFLISFLFAFIFYLFLNLKAKILLISIFFPALGYVIPVYKNKRLRDLPFLKVFLTSIFWTVLTVLLPHISLSNSSVNIYPLLIDRFLFLLALALLFDIRDVEIEKKSGVKTFPNVFGKKATVILTILLMSIWLIINFFYQNILVSAAMFTLYTLFVILSMKCLKPQKDIFYTIALDGLMIVQPLLFVIMECLKNTSG